MIRSSASRAGSVALLLLFAGCASLTPQQSTAVKDAQRLADTVTAAYGVEPVRIKAGDYLNSWYSTHAGWIGLELRILGTEEEKVVLPFHLGHVTLRHPDLPYERDKMERATLAANRRAVEIMVKFLGMTHPEAVERFTRYFMAINTRLLAYAEFARQTGRLNPPLARGHPHPCAQLNDLWSHFSIASPAPLCVTGPTQAGNFDFWLRCLPPTSHFGPARCPE